MSNFFDMTSVHGLDVRSNRSVNLFVVYHVCLRLKWDLTHVCKMGVLAFTHALRTSFVSHILECWRSTARSFSQAHPSPQAQKIMQQRSREIQRGSE